MKRLMILALVCGAIALTASDEVGQNCGCCGDDNPTGSLIEIDLPEENLELDQIECAKPKWGNEPIDTRHVCEV